MAGIQDTNTVDLVGQNKEGNVELIIVEENPWTGSKEQLDFLLKKVNSYIQFFIGGQFKDMYPQLLGKPTSIHIMSSYDLDSETVRFFEDVKENINAKYHIGLTFKLMPKG